jgi:hypothetical protein
MKHRHAAVPADIARVAVVVNVIAARLGVAPDIAGGAARRAAV